MTQNSLRGRFVRGDGSVIPNNVTRLGCKRILDAAFRDGSLSLWMTLVSGGYAPDLTVASLTEPTIGTNGFARQALATGVSAQFAEAVLTDDGAYIASSVVTFQASGGAFDAAVTRFAIVDSLNSNTANVLALSAPVPEITVDESTPLVDRQFSYRIYL